jgi:homoserine kinase type II
MFRDNVLFSERGLTGVVDFHHAATGYWLYDLAVVANDWCNDSGGVLDADRTLALLRA